jgi:multiple sugar transport system ATP-binding protein
VQSQLAELERDLDGEALRTQLVVGLDGASKISEGDEAEIWVDASKMHLFDPSTGENLTVDRSHAGLIPGDTDTGEVASEQDSIATPGEQEEGATG